MPLLPEFRPEEKFADLAILDDHERGERIRRAYDAYYNGGPDTLKVRKGEINDNVKINYSRLVVDAGVANLFGSQLIVAAPAGSPDEIQEEIDKIIRDNGGGLLWQRLGVSGAIGGTAYYRLQVKEDESIRIIIVDPATVEIEWDEQDHEYVTGYIVTFIPNAGFESRARRHLIRREAGGGWVIIEQVAIEDAWRTVSEEEWPWPFPPMGHAQNIPSPHETYGISDLEPDVLDLCDGINRVVSNINRIVRLYAHPRTWGKMIGDALNMNANPGAVIRLEHPEAELHNLEMSSDLSSSIDLYRRMVNALHETTRIPEVATGKLDSAGQLSSLALRILYTPLIQKTESKRRTYGQAIEQMFMHALALRGYEDDILVELIWPELLPADPEVLRRTALIDAQLGASKATLLEQLGYDPDVEAENALAENQQQQTLFNAGGIGQ
jgi:hypothetical protein